MVNSESSNNDKNKKKTQHRKCCPDGEHVKEPSNKVPPRTVVEAMMLLLVANARCAANGKLNCS